MTRFARPGGRMPLAFLMLSLLAAPASAQAGSETLRGSVVKDGQPVAQVPVTLHRVTEQGSGALETLTSAADGSFAFTLPPAAETGFTVFFGTAEYQGVRYFGRPLHAQDDRTGYMVEVFDTTTAVAASIRMPRRDVMLISETDGGWEINEVVRIANPTDQTLVSRGGLPTVEFRIPEGALDFEAGEGDVGPGDIVLMNDRVLVLTPLLPGEREIFLRYRLPRGTHNVSISYEGPVDTANVFLRLPVADALIEGLSTSEIIEAGDERFLRYGAVDLEAGARIGMTLRGATGAPVDPIVAALAVTALLLLLGVGAAMRNRGAPPAAGGPPPVDRARVLAGSASERAGRP